MCSENGVEIFSCSYSAKVGNANFFVSSQIEKYADTSAFANPQNF
jgi:hypothetical protein